MTSKLLFDLMNAKSVSGDESHVRTIIEQQIKKHVDTISVDQSGNLIGIKRGKQPKVMLAAHMDEIGLIVKSIDGDGKIRISMLGGIELLTLIGQRVHIETNKKKIHGIISTAAMNDGNLMDTFPTREDLFIDTGLTRKELLSYGINVGTFISLEQYNSFLGSKDLIYGKALDDRIGCYVLIELCKKLRTAKNELYFVFTVQEEVGLYGARTSAFNINPDWAVAVDVTNTYEAKQLRLVGKGPSLTVKDAEMIGNPCLNRWITDIAKKLKIPIQPDVSDLGTSDALTISISRGGIPTAMIGVPVRNIHSTIGIASLKDIDNLIRILYALLKDPPKALVL
ncbi:MAG: M20/M25/M40 family metallo-hydrolase [Candidatus Aenigmarchaeota archaeon]|nr:M20/M25/M40 family metallo-hydrolase [Candidatus Aenigmarchaeota archaeon]